MQLSYCEPATPLETSGARLGAADLVVYRDHPKMIGLAEFMNVPGVLDNRVSPFRLRALCKIMRPGCGMVCSTGPLSLAYPP